VIGREIPLLVNCMPAGEFLGECQPESITGKQTAGDIVMVFEALDVQKRHAECAGGDQT
jgi:hypothetical protein